MKSLGEVDLHDAQIHGIAADLENRTVTVSLSAYPSPDSPKRKRAEILFGGVRTFTSSVDCNALMLNASAGNVNSWAPAPGAGLTHIYLVDGLISVDASRVRFEFAK